MNDAERAALERKHASEYLGGCGQRQPYKDAVMVAATALFYAALIGLGILIGWLVWG